MGGAKSIIIYVGRPRDAKSLKTGHQEKVCVTLQIWIQICIAEMDSKKFCCSLIVLANFAVSRSKRIVFWMYFFGFRSLSFA